MSLKTPETVRKLQQAFYAKAKDQPSYRFHQLYDKIYRRDILNHAFWRCVANCRKLAAKASAGVDGQTFEAIFEYGYERWLPNLTIPNIVEQDHRRVKFRLQPMLGLKSFYNGRRVIIAIVLAQKIHKHQFAIPARFRSNPAGNLAPHPGSLVRIAAPHF